VCQFGASAACAGASGKKCRAALSPGQHVSRSSGHFARGTSACALDCRSVSFNWRFIG
jgi:hypothetical protein